MKLLMKNNCPNEFLEGSEYTAVDLDMDLAEAIKGRVAACRRLLADDPSLCETLFEDDRPVCFNTFDALDELIHGPGSSPILARLEEGDGWTVVPEGLRIPGREVVATDCRRMVLTVTLDDVSVGWTYLIEGGDERVWTARARLTELAVLTGESRFGAIVREIGGADESRLPRS